MAGKTAERGQRARQWAGLFTVGVATRSGSDNEETTMSTGSMAGHSEEGDRGADGGNGDNSSVAGELFRAGLVCGVAEQRVLRPWLGTVRHLQRCGGAAYGSGGGRGRAPRAGLDGRDGVDGDWVDFEFDEFLFCR